MHLYLVGDYRADLERIKMSLAQVEEGLDPVLEEELVEMAHFMKGYAKRFVRVDTGSLKKSIRVEHIRRLAVRVRAGGYIINPKTGKLVNYAVYVEAKYPFMRPAWEHIKDYVTQRVGEVLTDLTTSASLTRGV